MTPQTLKNPLLKLPFPLRDKAKYPRPEDEPIGVACRRQGLRSPEPGEDPIAWAQNQSRD